MKTVEIVMKSWDG